MILQKIDAHLFRCPSSVGDWFVPSPLTDEQPSIAHRAILLSKRRLATDLWWQCTVAYVVRRTLQLTSDEFDVKFRANNFKSHSYPMIGFFDKMLRLLHRCVFLSFWAINTFIFFRLWDLCSLLQLNGLLLSNPRPRILGSENITHHTHGRPNSQTFVEMRITKHGFVSKYQQV